MTIIRRIKDYMLNRKTIRHYETVVPDTSEPTEYDLKGEDREVIEMNQELGIGGLVSEDVKRLEGKVK